MNLEEYYTEFGHLITQDSERLFVEDILYPLLGDHIGSIIPQHQFLDSSGKSRRIDFACLGSRALLALEINGESYHAEGIVPNETFDDNLYRQNEILRAGYKLARFSYNQLQDEKWRPIIFETIRGLISETSPELLPESEVVPNEIQTEALDALDYCRRVNAWQKAIVIMPTGSGKTLLSALDGKRFGGRQLFLVHRLDILAQSVEVYKMVWPMMNYGFLTGEVQENEMECDVLFASKDTLRQPDQLMRFKRDAFDYMVIDEVHHGQSPSYRSILEHFRPAFMLGMTATPDRMDRKDIFELFDYNKAYETTLHEVIERGFLVPYTYFGLTDDIDYTKIKSENNKYRVSDLERLLIIPERNKAILDQYLEKGLGDKTIGFCVSIEHAERMADFFSENGISAAAIHSGVSGAQERDRLIKEFRENRITVAFTVDLFNEGIDFPNVQVLMFLRPTESKTVFLQQLGRGLRRALGKERLRILDFIGNYQRANRIRDYLSKKKEIVIEKDSNRRKFKYIYSTGCEVKFTADVEEILDRQDAQELGISKSELTEAYYVVAERLRHRPSRNDINQHGEYRSALYSQVFGSWSRFIREIGAYTEASYHYPQGTHVGHVLSILWHFGLPNRKGTAFDDDYIRLRGDLAQGRLGNYQRQLKYKLQAAMELGLLEDDRQAVGNDFIPRLTPIGHNLRSILKTRLARVNLSFTKQNDGIPSTRMTRSAEEYNALVRSALEDGFDSLNTIRSVICRMPAVQQMMSFMYQVGRTRRIERAFIYNNFFQAPFVKQFMEQEGIEPASPEASRRRCPFLLNLLSAAGVVVVNSTYIEISQLILFPALVRSYINEDIEIARQRLLALKSAWPDRSEKMESETLSILRELFGEDFLTNKYIFKKTEMAFIEDL